MNETTLPPQVNALNPRILRFTFLSTVVGFSVWVRFRPRPRPGPATDTLFVARDLLDIICKEQEKEEYMFTKEYERLSTIHFPFYQ